MGPKYYNKIHNPELSQKTSLGNLMTIYYIVVSLLRQEKNCGFGKLAYIFKIELNLYAKDG